MCETAVNEFSNCRQTRVKDQGTNVDDHDAAYISCLSVQLIDKCIRQLHIGKSPGIDGLSTEHLLYAHPLIVTHMSYLFKCIAVCGYVPNAFGRGIIIPIIKDKLADANDLNNYRGITLIPVISKLFELIILELCQPFLKTDELQFGFKKNTGTANAVFVLSETVKHFLNNGSNIFAAALDLKKVFDKVNHFKLFSSLIKQNIPMWILAIMINWYSKLYVSVRWNNTYSYNYQVKSGVRQGGPLSPALFNIFVNSIIEELQGTGAGCKLGGFFISS